MASKKVFYNTDLLRHILSYIVIPKYNLLSWVEELFDEYNKTSHDQLYKSTMNKYVESYDYLTKEYNKINWNYLSNNIYAISLLEKNIKKIDWSELSYNQYAIHILEKNIDKIDWNNIVFNEKAIDIIRNNLDKITNFIDIGYNINVIDIIEKYFDKIHIVGILSNKNAIYLQKYENFILKYSNFIITDKYVKNNKYQKDNIKNIQIWTSFFSNEHIHIILEKYEDKLNWNILSKDPYFGNAINNINVYPFILRNYEKIGYYYLSMCNCPKIVEILKNNIDKINWKMLSINYNNDAIKLFHNNIDKIDWYMLSRNACNEAIKILKKYPDKINYDRLSLNKNLKAIKIYYNYYKNNKLLIDYISFNNWVSIIVSSNKNIFIKNYNGTNKRIDRFIRKLIL
jgi:hypothetical protein